MPKVVLRLVKSDVAAGAINTLRPLTHSLDYSKERLAMDATAEPERWLPIPGYEGHYEISDHGRVRSLERLETLPTPPWTRRRRERILKPSTNKTQKYCHLSCTIFKDGRSRKLRPHIAVCTIFNGPKPTPQHEVRHLNGNPLDNRAVNLAWGTHSENMLDKVRHGTHHLANKTHCPRGHEYAGENLYVRPSRNSRVCRACARIYNARRRKPRRYTLEETA